MQQQDAKKPKFVHLAVRLSDNRLARKFSDKAFAFFAGFGYLATLANIALTILQLALGMPAKNIFAAGAGMTLAGAFLITGTLCGLLASAGSYRSCQARWLSAKESTKAYIESDMPSPRTFDRFEGFQAVFAGLLVVSIIGMGSAGIEFNSGIWVAAFQLASVTLMTLASTTKLFEDNWLTSCKERVEGKIIEHLNNKLTRKSNQLMVLRSLNAFNQFQQKVTKSPTLTIWHGHGLELAQVQTALHLKIIRSEFITSDFIATDLLTVQAALELGANAYKTLHHDFFQSHFHIIQERFPEQAVEILHQVLNSDDDAPIIPENLNNPWIQQALMDQQISWPLALQMSPTHIETLKQHHSTALLLYGDVINEQQFLNLSPTAINLINSIISDRVITLFAANIRIPDLLKLSPDRQQLLVAACSSERGLNDINAREMRTVVDSLINTEALEHYLQGRSLPTTSQSPELAESSEHEDSNLEDTSSSNTSPRP